MISCSSLRTSLVSSATLLRKTLTFVMLNRFCSLSKKKSTPPVLKQTMSRWMECQPKTDEKCTTFLHYISSFEGTSYKNLLYNTNSFFFWEVSLLRTDCWFVEFINQGFKCLSPSIANFFILKLHCFMLLLNSITSKYKIQFCQKDYLGMLPAFSDI